MRHPFEPPPIPPEPDDWHRDAACRDTSSPNDWFPDQPGARSPAGARAINVCKECPVQQQCADYAAEANERYGIWGGQTEARRKRQRQARNRATPPYIRHGTHAGYQREAYYGIPACDACKAAHAEFQSAKRRIRERRKQRNQWKETG